MRRILGIDPGSRITGVGIIEVPALKADPICLYSGCVRLKSATVPERLGILQAEIQDIVKAFQPTELAVERVFMHKNANSALVLGQARGAAIASAMSAGIGTVCEYSPRAVKQGVVGYGNASKEQIIRMVMLLLKLPKPLSADAADALAVALCHLNTTSGALVLTAKRTTRRSSQKRSSKWVSYDRTNTR